MNTAFETGHPSAQRPCAFRGLVADSVPTRRLLTQAAQLAGTDRTLLLLGEPGTGKRSLAAAIHAESRWCGGSLVALPALSVFERLAGSRADEEAQRAAAHEVGLTAAQGGTVVLTGFGELRLVEQAALQRHLKRLARADGGQRPSGFRVVLTAEGSLGEVLRTGQFHRDVYHRAEIVPLFIPALRDRPGDLALLAGRALARAGRDPSRAGLQLAALALLKSYFFPGNVRELETVVAEAAAQAPPGPIGCRSLPPYLLRAVSHPGTAAEPPIERTLEDVEIEHIRRVLTSTHGNRSAAARILGVSRVGLLGKLKRYDIDIPPQSGGHAR